MEFKIGLDEVRMKYGKVKSALFIDRPNRFVAHVDIDGRVEAVHVKNTGRCKEIFIKGTKVILEEGTNPNRKTKYSIIGAYKNETFINTDSQVPNSVVYDALANNKISQLQDISYAKREVTFGNSRFDIYFESERKKGFIEVKGVTLEKGGICMFPDAPTKRGSKHIRELIKAKKQGYDAYVFFLIQMEDMDHFIPNYKTDPEFASILKEAYGYGVEILVYNSILREDEITIGDNMNFHF